MFGWTVDRILHFGPGDFIECRVAHFGFHDRRGRYFAIAHQKHFIGLVGDDGELEWTVAPRPVFPGIRNIAANLNFPMYVDALPDDTLVVSNFKTAELYRIDLRTTKSRLLVDGHAVGLGDMGNCVVDEKGDIWVNEVTGCRLWRFDASGRPVQVLGTGTPGFRADPISFEEVRFNWIYDIRRGPEGDIYVLDSKNFAVRVIDVDAGCVRTIAGNGRAGYTGDGADARDATFGSDPHAKFDGPISLSLDDDGNAYVGDRFNHVVRMIERSAGVITTIAGDRAAEDGRMNDPTERDPLKLNLPQISSMDYHRGLLFVPTDLTPDAGDLAVLRKV